MRLCSLIGVPGSAFPVQQLGEHFGDAIHSCMQDAETPSQVSEIAIYAIESRLMFQLSLSKCVQDPGVSL